MLTRRISASILSVHGLVIPLNLDLDEITEELEVYLESEGNYIINETFDAEVIYTDEYWNLIPEISSEIEKIKTLHFKSTESEIVFQQILWNIKCDVAITSQMEEISELEVMLTIPWYLDFYYKQNLEFEIIDDYIWFKVLSAELSS